MSDAVPSVFRAVAHCLFASTIIIPIVQMGKLRLEELSCPKTLSQKPPIGLCSDSEVGAGATDIVQRHDTERSVGSRYQALHSSERRRAPPRAL